MTQPAQPPPSISGAILGSDIGRGLGAAPSAGAAGGGFQVTAESLLNAANKLQAQIQEISTTMSSTGVVGMTAAQCGQDPVSGPAAAAFEQKLTAMSQQFRAYVKNLTEGVTTLREQAKQYGATDEQIRQSWKSYVTATQSSTGPVAR